MLIAVGELGYENATVQDAIDRTGLSRNAFYRHFKNKEECFEAAHREEADRLFSALRAAGYSEACWIDGLRAALRVLLGYVAESPTPARAILIEVHSARGAALDRYKEIIDALTHDIDLVRREVGSSHHSPPPLTARFVVATVESTIGACLTADIGRSAPSLLPGLVHFVVLYYLGEDAAESAMELT